MIKLILLIMLVIFVLACLYQMYTTEYFAGEATNQFGGAPKKSDPEAIAKCEKKTEDLKQKIKKDEQDRMDANAMNLKNAQLQQEDAIRTQEDQMKMYAEGMKEANKKKGEMLSKMSEISQAITDCNDKLTSLEASLVDPTKCCDKERKERDIAVKWRQEIEALVERLKAEFGPLESKFNDLTAKKDAIVKEYGEAVSKVLKLTSDAQMLRNELENRKKNTI